MKRRLLKVALLAGLMTVGSVQGWADGFAYLTVTQDGERVNYAVSDIQKIVFESSSTNMVLMMADGSSVRLPLSELSTLTFGDGTTADISLARNSQTGLKLEDGQLTVDMEEGGTVTLYDAAGKQVRSLRAKSGRNTLSLGQLPKGVYIVKVNGNSQKFLNR